MGNFIKLHCRWKDGANNVLSDLGIDTKDKWYYKEVNVNLDRIAFIEMYEEHIVVAFSGIIDDALITSLKYTKENLKLFIT